MSKDGQWPVSFRNPGKLLLKNYRNAWLLVSKISRNRWCLKTFAQYCKPCLDETVPWAWKQFRSLGMLCQQNSRKLLYFPVHSGEEECVNILRLASLMSNSWQKTQKSKNGIRKFNCKIFLCTFSTCYISNARRPNNETVFCVGLISPLQIHTTQLLFLQRGNGNAVNADCSVVKMYCHHAQKKQCVLLTDSVILGASLRKTKININKPNMQHLNYSAST